MPLVLQPAMSGRASWAHRMVEGLHCDFVGHSTCAFVSFIVRLWQTRLSLLNNFTQGQAEG